mmetsp:Transcript_37968/g.61511  ORF Transcript_37968/g.61511 Transcript_37968/m.61511 type:complete len:248 (-) Transcript_37968:266-1009(-)|eukprot:CAMPEP_0184653734 /NCGR_PEP_ID=MMETSP0308-20130426/11455_1 /TAXON_ID=38269 /ORGANISM="Gloeochaete witrockiana, Strain SAG 46.84" /LENGTH=247 /DNA_ID=CAMNT_0027089359 /DNA_START=69 /DNA_END=812 /DNA_ORIENTATION=-
MEDTKMEPAAVAPSQPSSHGAACACLPLTALLRPGSPLPRQGSTVDVDNQRNFGAVENDPVGASTIDVFLQGAFSCPTGIDAGSLENKEGWAPEDVAAPFTPEKKPTIVTQNLDSKKSPEDKIGSLSLTPLGGASQNAQITTAKPAEVKLTLTQRSGVLQNWHKREFIIKDTTVIKKRHTGELREIFKINEVVDVKERKDISGKENTFEVTAVHNNAKKSYLFSAPDKNQMKEAISKIKPLGSQNIK